MRMVALPLTEGAYYIRFGSEWFPQEAMVEAGTSEIPIKHLHTDSFRVQRGMKLGVVGGIKLVPEQFE